MAIETLPHMFESMIKTEGPNAHLIKEMFTNPLNVKIFKLFTLCSQFLKLQ